MDTHPEYSRHASLIFVGRLFRDLGLWPVIEEHVHIQQKVRQFTPLEKLLDAFITILAGGHGVVESNTRVRPEPAVQHAFGRTHCAEQSTISRTLSACTAENVEQMRTALRVILRQHGRCCAHEPDRSLLDIDLTGLVAGRQGEGSTKGYFPHQRSKRGRQLGRVLATRTGELVAQRLYPGKRQLEQGFQELVTDAENVLNLAETQRSRTILRADGGAGSDANLTWALNRGYHVLIKVHNWARAARLAATVTEWHRDDKVADRALGWVTQPMDYGHATRQIAIRTPRRDRTGQIDWHYQVLVTTLTDAMVFALLEQPVPATPEPASCLRALAHAYDLRDGALETENRSDKQGLGLSHRNKRSFAAQEILILLAELAHNLTLWTRRRLAQSDPRFDKFGIQRLVRDVFQIGGQATLSSDQRVLAVALNHRHPYARAVERAFAGSLVA